MPVAAGDLYGVRAWTRVPAGQNPDGRAGVEISWYGSAGCSASKLGGIGRRLGPLVEGGWAPLRVVGSAPVNAQSTQVSMTARNDSGGFYWFAHFDDAFFGGSQSLDPLSIAGIEYRGTDMPAGTLTDADQLRVLFRDSFETDEGLPQ